MVERCSGGAAFVFFTLLIPIMSLAENVVMIGYWPPTNEMLRQWSDNPSQNPEGWRGQDWGGFGHDVYSFFPEFPGDGIPFNDPSGSDGRVGSPESDFRVDYQDTSTDFWTVIFDLEPVAVVTFSWGGGDNRWEIEGVEGGHGSNGNPALDWINDGYGEEFFPTQDSIHALSWDAISTYQSEQLASQLPIEDILVATADFGFANVFVDELGTSGRYLSGFLALHGLYYNSIAESNLSAGHIHVGGGLSVSEATQLTEATLSAVLKDVNRTVPEPGGTVILFVLVVIAATRRC